MAGVRGDASLSPQMPQMPPAPDATLLDRYLAGEAAPEERQAVEAWLAEQPQERALLAAIRAGVADPYGPVPSYDEEARIAAVVDYGVRAARRARRQPVASSAITPSLFRHGESGRRFGVWAGTLSAAAAALVIALGWMGIAHRIARSTPPAMATYTTGNGQRATISLTDGSTVLLNVGSRLQVPADYAAGDHTVRLTGAALFTVTHHDSRAFTVLAGGTATRVLGTSFVVRHYGTDTTTTVAVRHGKVAVGHTVVPASSYVEADTRGVSPLRYADESQFGFASGVLVLRKMSLAQAIPELNRWYDADIRLGDASLAAKPITGQIPAGSLVNLTELLQVVFNVRVVRDGRILTLYPR